ncbi:hypothetical protein GOP47_0005049 [Adiantum capillus-veneris]|uniref:Uncharacterized protein n=1 Tax=Adiantum capillus-veneris TaxID=13818 RepID=A0A9D4ZNT1_ADICA|nr:hypothetical protein GOP47_0005049 [Adiantum capillus-veneris]
MSARGSNASMGARNSNLVAERRLRPLWDAIDSGQFKQALKLVNSRLTKDPDSVYLIVLKALVLERLEKAEEALALCEQAKASEPIDDLTLSALQVVYHRLGRSEQATLCYELACSKAPQNLELMMGLFNCHVRDYSFLKQQQVALKMHKLFGEERFLLWSVCSIQLQVSCANKDKTLLSLAEALLKKRSENQGFEELEALRVYLAILEEANKYDAALALLSSKSGDLFSINSEKLKLEGKLLLLSQQYELAAKVLKEVLEISPDDWATYLLYLDAILEVPTGGAGIFENSSIQNNCKSSVSGVSNEEAENRLQVAKAFVESLQDKDQRELRRGPFLAIVEIERRRFLLQLGGQNVETFADHLQASVVNYFRRFGNLVSFASDVQGYLNLIQQCCCDGFLERLHLACNEAQGESSVMILRRRISLFQVQMQLSFQATPDRDLVAQAIEVAKLYVESLKLSKDLDPQENMWGEELITMAATFLVQLFLSTRNPGYVVEAIILLEFGLAFQKYSFQYKIMLVSLYSTAFCSSLAFDWYKSLDVKNILIETLSHHMLLPLRRSMLWSELETMLSDTVKFHKDYAKEAADLTIVAYRNCNYSKVLEFVQFKNRLQHSHNLLFLKAEGVFLQLIQKAAALDDFLLVLEELDGGNELLKWGSDENLANLSFNEGLDTRPWWSPAPGKCILTEAVGKQPSLQHKESQEQGIEREEGWRRLLCKRCLLPRLLFLSLNAVRFKDDGENSVKSHADELQCLVKKYGECLGFQKEKLEEVFVDVSYLKAVSKIGELDASDMFSLVLFRTSYQYMFESNFHGLSSLIDMAKLYIAELTGFAKISDLKMWEPSHSDIVASWSALPSLVLLVTEGFTWYSLCLQMWRRYLQPGGKAGRRKKKGANIASAPDLSADGWRSTLLNELQANIDAFCNMLKELLRIVTRLLWASEESFSRILQNYVDEGIHSEPLRESVANPIPGLIFNAFKSTLDATDSLGERLDSVIQAHEILSLTEKMAGSQCATLQKLSGVLSSILNGLQPAAPSSQKGL